MWPLPAWLRCGITFGTVSGGSLLTRGSTPSGIVGLMDPAVLILGERAIIAPVIARLDQAIPVDSGGFGGARIKTGHDEKETFSPERSK